MYQVLFVIFFFLSFIARSFAAPYAYVANEGDNTISVIDTQINQVVKVITSSNIKAPVSLALSKDKKTLFASYYQTAPYKGGYSKIDLSSGLVEVNASSKVLLPAALSLSPDGSDLYLTDNGVHDFYGFNVASSAISSFVNYTYESEVLSNLITLNGKKAYLPQGGYDVVTVIHLETGVAPIKPIH
jgi:YVTN family beta-propeller protein